MNQKTIAQSVSIKGAGLHLGKPTTLTLNPATENHGIVFKRVDLPNTPSIKVGVSTVLTDPGVSRCSVLSDAGVKIFTVEHLLAAFNGLDVDNCLIEINGEEIPGGDGSSLEFVRAIKQAGIVELKAPKEVFMIKEPIMASNNGASVMIVPSDKFVISYTLDYPHPALRSQFFTTEVTRDLFESQLAPARTFCMDTEAEEIRARGLGLGATVANTLVMTAQGPKDNTLRFDNECARHKALDIVGDLFLLGYRVQGAVFATKSGHSLNRDLVKKIDAQRKKYAVGNYVPLPSPSGTRVFNIEQIMKILPHRYPFLLVDRVIEVEAGKKGIGVKNVTINDGFFQGHFPTKPVMPGVLMVEAMAQTAGVVVLTGGAHGGKVALFMSINEVKFRRVVVPGDQLMMEVEIVRDRERTAQVKGVAKVDGEVAVEADMMFSYTDASYLQS